MTAAYINEIETAVPPHDVHKSFVRYARKMLESKRDRNAFDKLCERSQIEHRWSCQLPDEDATSTTIDGRHFIRIGEQTPMRERMHAYQIQSFRLSEDAVRRLARRIPINGITHIVITSCTGFSAPGLDLQLIARFGLSPSIERTTVGFMGCYAAVNALKLAHHIVRSDPSSKVLVLSIEMCTLHLQHSADLARVLMFLLFADGCAVAIVSAEPVGLKLDSFHATVIPGTADQMSWHITDAAFDMMLSGDVPRSVFGALRHGVRDVLANGPANEIDMWAVHPGGKTILDAAEAALDLEREALLHSRNVLRQYGNMSSPTVLFVLKSFLDEKRRNQRGCGMSFGPGLTAETFLFRTAE